MRHLSADQLIDLAEGTQPESSLPHLHTCDRCRQQLAELRTTMSMVAGAGVPDSSPLAWNPVAARVHEAIELERVRKVSIAGRLRAAGAAVFAALNLVPVQIAAVAVLVSAAVLIVERNPPPLVQRSRTSAVAVDSADLAPTTEDASLSLVADLAAGLDWEAAAEAGLTTHMGVDDDVVNQLTEAERRELRALLQGELTASRRGA